MKNSLRLSLLIFIISLFISCSAAPPITKLYHGTIDNIPETIYVIPFLDSATNDSIDSALLINYQKQLANELKKNGKFANVFEVGHNSIPNGVIVKCTITQFDPTARRMVVVSEVIDETQHELLAKLVTHSNIISIIWPFDYFGALNLTSTAIIEDIAKRLSQ